MTQITLDGNELFAQPRALDGQKHWVRQAVQPMSKDSLEKPTLFFEMRVKSRFRNVGR